MAADEGPGIELAEREGFLEIRFLGRYALDRFLRQIEAGVAACLERRQTRLLADLMALTDIPDPLPLTERYDMGQKAAEMARGRIKIAVWAPARFIDPRKFGAQVARNRGLLIDVFADRAQALEWLLSASNETPP